MKLRSLIASAAIATTAIGLAACDPAPPYEGCNLIAVSYEYSDPNGTYSVPSTDEYQAQLIAAGWDLDYWGASGAWVTDAGGSIIVHGYSAEEDGHWFDCPH
jgi:hypothetical protein